MILERFILRALKEGVAFLLANPAMIRTIMGDDSENGFGLDAAEVEEIITDFTKSTPNPTAGYARRDSKFPLWSVTLLSDSQTQDFLGSEGGALGDAQLTSARFFGVGVNVIIYTQHPDVTSYQYHLAKWCLLDQEPVLWSKGFSNLRLSGADLAPDQATMPAGLFLRRLTVSADREYAQPRRADTLEPTATSVSGIHYDSNPSAGAPGEDGGDVESHVTTFIGEGDGEET